MMAAKQTSAEVSGVWTPADPASGRLALPELVASTGISLRMWRLYAQAWLICLLFPILALLRLHLAPIDLLLVLGGLAIFVACYTWVMWLHPVHNVRLRPTPVRRALPVLTGLILLVLWLSVVYDSAFLWLLVGVSAITGVTLPARSAFVAVMALTLLTLFVSVSVSGGIAAADWLHILPLVLLVRGLGLDMIGLVCLASALREVHAARTELARLAVIEERLRVARDLHDLLGHTLSLITLKSELAGRLIETEPARAAQEIREVERTARRSLREVREAVAGYRQPRLLSELDGARQLLEAAGIAYQIEHTAGALPPATDAVLAWTVREGVTNVIRHSRAHHCTIRVTCASKGACAEVLNDGVPLDCPHTTQTDTGSGLAGLAERVCTAGGQIEAGPQPAAGFRLWVELPRLHPAMSEQEPHR
jgi:two-component system, NarL family, sensor histidine kinase DesK